MAGCDHFLTSAQLRSFRRNLLRWYDANRRQLPWRRDRDPYRVWVSEIMLQQTRVAAVLDHYARFLQRFPTVQSLAAAREASVLAAWSGLGYYHRARRMHQAAKIVTRERRGTFPRGAEEWLELPGIGRYTAAAIASIAFGEPVAVVDGNVARVLLRVHGHRLKRTAAWHYAEELLDRARSGDFNQAMMELGAAVCTPRAPRCMLCPLHSLCKSRGAQEPAATGERKSKQLAYVLAQKNGAILLVQRPADASLMAAMWELPSLPVENTPSLSRVAERACPEPAEGTGPQDAPLLRLRHSITDTDYRVTVFARAPELLNDLPTARWFTPRQCSRLPLTGLTRKILGRAVL